MNAVRLYARLVGFSLRSQLQYRASIVMETVAHLLATGIDFLAIWALFSRFGSLHGWTLAEVGVFYGAVTVAFALADSITAGFDRFGILIRQGELDRYLLRPRGVLLQVLGYELTLRRMGRLAQGLAVLVYGLSHTGSALPWPAAAGVLVWAILGMVCFFVALLVLQATLAIKTVESLEIMNVFTYGGMSAAQMPFAIYARWFRRLFTFLVPLGAVSYYPVLTLLGRSAVAGVPPWVGWVSPLAGPLFLTVALALWRVGLRWYSSTGS